jgi:hypothetical protein
MAKRGTTTPPQAGAHTIASLRKQWPVLHAGDLEPWPASEAVQQAWLSVHNGAFEEGIALGVEAGGSGVHAANHAACVVAAHAEPDASRAQRLYLDAAARAQALQREAPDDPNAWYWYAVALGRYSQTVSVAKAWAEGLSTKVRKALDTTLRLAPRHAQAHVALAAFHAEVIDKVGVLIGGLTYGAQAATGVAHYRTALALTPHCAAIMLEAANGLVMLEGEARRAEARALLEQAASRVPRDAVERLDVAMAQQELAQWAHDRPPGG